MLRNHVRAGEHCYLTAGISCRNLCRRPQTVIGRRHHDGRCGPAAGRLRRDGYARLAAASVRLGPPGPLARRVGRAQPEMGLAVPRDSASAYGRWHAKLSCLLAATKPWSAVLLSMARSSLQWPTRASATRPSLGRCWRPTVCSSRRRTGVLHPDCY